MRVWFFGSWVGLVACLTLGAGVDNAVGFGIMAFFAVFTFAPPVLAAVASRKGADGDDWFLGFGQWAWAFGLLVTALGAMPARLAFMFELATGSGWEIGELIVLFVVAVGMQFCLVSALHGTMFAWSRPQLGDQGRREVIRYGRGPVSRTARAVGLGVACAGMVTFQALIMMFLAEYWWGDDARDFGIPIASTLLLVGLGVYWLGAAARTRQWFSASPEARLARVRVVDEEA